MAMKPGRVADQVAGMDFEELCEEAACGVGEVRTRAAFDLGEVRLAEVAAELTADGAGDFELAHLAAQAPQLAFDRAERPDLFAERHCNRQYTYCRLQCQITGN